MKRKFKKLIGFVFAVVLAIFLSSCENPFLADVTHMYKVTFVTNCDTEIDSYRTSKIDSIQTLTKDGYEFDGWYTSETFEGEQIILPYKVTKDVILYARWISNDKIARIDSNNYKISNNLHTYYNVILSFTTEAEKAILSGTFNDLTIKLNKANAKIKSY